MASDQKVVDWILVWSLLGRWRRGFGRASDARNTQLEPVFVGRDVLRRGEVINEASSMSSHHRTSSLAGHLEKKLIDGWSVDEESNVGMDVWDGLQKGRGEFRRRWNLPPRGRSPVIRTCDVG